MSRRHNLVGLYQLLGVSLCFGDRHPFQHYQFEHTYGMPSFNYISSHVTERPVLTGTVRKAGTAQARV
jgi:hypothetical protein